MMLRRLPILLPALVLLVVTWGVAFEADAASARCAKQRAASSAIRKAINKAKAKRRQRLRESAARKRAYNIVSYSARAIARSKAIAAKRARYVSPFGSTPNEIGRRTTMDFGPWALVYAKHEIAQEQTRRAELAAKLYATLRDLEHLTEHEPPLSIDRAASLGEIERVAELINEGKPVGQQDDVGRTPLHWAAVAGRDGVVELLIKQEVPLNTRDSFRGYTPLHYAAEHGKEQVARLLIDAGADIDAKNDWYQTPLDLAERHRREDVALMLRRAEDLRTLTQ